MNIDEPTLMVALGVTSLTASAMFFTLHASARHIAGVQLWACACLSVGFAVLLDAPRLIGDWQWASLLFNIPFSAGHALFLVGTAQFVGRPLRNYGLILLTAFAVLPTIAFTLVWPDSVARIAAEASCQAGMNGLTAWYLWRYRERHSGLAYRIAAVGLLAEAAASLAQGLFVVISPTPISYAAPELPLANIVNWLGVMANVLIGNWILFLLVMLRLVGELKTVAAHDPLTGLLNRRGLRSHIDSVLASERSVPSLAVLLLDIDHFKALNDQHGHDVGDGILVTMGDVMRARRSPHIMPCRWGGEEFCFVVDGHSRESIVELAEHVRQEFHRASCRYPGLPSGVTVSIGVAALPIDGDFEFSRLVALADAQLYLAKRGGRDRVCSAIDDVGTVATRMSSGA